MVVCRCGCCVRGALFFSFSSVLLLYNLREIEEKKERKKRNKKRRVGEGTK